MADYKTMYYHMAGRVAGAVDALEASNAALTASSAAIKASLQALNSTLETSSSIVYATLQASAAALDGCIASLYALGDSLKRVQQDTEEMFLSSEDEDA